MSSLTDDNPAGAARSRILIGRYDKVTLAYAKSLMDYLFRWLELRFLKGEQGILFELSNGKQPHTEAGNASKALSEIVNLGDAPTCQFCGSLMVRNGSCYCCMECGGTSGCS